MFQPLYIRYDPDPVPGLCGAFSLYLSKHFVSNTRWRVLPVRSPNITRFEQEGTILNVRTIFNVFIITNHKVITLSKLIIINYFHSNYIGTRSSGTGIQFKLCFYFQVNQDVVINHCATNLNLGIHLGCWAMGFYGKVSTKV